MPEDIVEAIDIDEMMPVIHKMGKYVLGCIAAFAATQIVEKVYDAVYIAYKQKA
jgi:hypothetical protein